MFELRQFSLGVQSSLKYSKRDNHLRYTPSTLLQFEYKKNVISLMVSYEIGPKNIASGLRQLK